MQMGERKRENRENNNFKTEDKIATPHVKNIIKQGRAEKK